jgi:hypothetical protein
VVVCVYAVSAVRWTVSTIFGGMADLMLSKKEVLDGETSGG